MPYLKEKAGALVSQNIRVTIWNEYRQDRDWENIVKVYPSGMHTAIGEYLAATEDCTVRYATLDEPEHGLTQDVLDNTDVLFWWGHIAHDKVSDEIVERVYSQVIHKGMGMIFLHSAHASKLFKKFCGTNSEQLKWREAGEKERIWVLEPGHPIAQGLPECIELEHEEMYGERFNIPAPDELLFISWFKGGEVFRSGFVLNRGYGKIFYFRPGHEEHPTFYNEHIRKLLHNAARYVAPKAGPFQGPQVVYGNVPHAPEAL